MAESTFPTSPAGSSAPPRRSGLNIALWVLQVLLALLFVWGGGMKLVMTAEQMKGPVPLPEAFMRFIGGAELLGGFGLILPSLLRIRPGLTPLAAACLVIIMIGAVVVTLMGGGAAMAAMPLVTGILLAVVAYGRWKLVPIPARRG